MAQSQAFQRFYEDGKSHLPGALPVAMQAELFATLRDFLQATNIWQADFTVNVDPTSNVYVVTPAAGTAFQRLINLYNTTDLTKRWFWPATMNLPGTIVLLRTVDQPYVLAATMGIYALDPVDANGDPVFPTWILDKYFDTLFNGMLWRMFSQPGKPWSNAALAATRYKLYKMGRGECFAEVTRGNLYNAQAWGYSGALAVYGRQRGV